MIEMVVEWESVPLVPMIVIVNGWSEGRMPRVLTVSVEVDPVGLGEKVAEVTPCGSVPVERLTLPVKPPIGVIVTVNVVEPVVGTVADAGLTLIEKSPPVCDGAWTVSVAPTECTTVPLVPVIVNA